MTLQQKKAKKFAADLAEFERRKKELQGQDLTPEEYEKEIKKIADELDL